jgi:hypothetical protein
MARLPEPSVEHARLRIQAQLTRVKLREDKARAERSELDRLRQVDAEKTARLRALRLARAAADDCTSRRESARSANLAGTASARQVVRVPRA